MQFTSLFVYLLLSTAVAARGNNSTKAVIDKSLCKEMASLTKLVDLASNTTKLEEKAKNNATKVADIQAKASAAATQLDTMTTNTTLVTECSAIASSNAATKAQKDSAKAAAASSSASSSSTAESAGSSSFQVGGVMSAIAVVVAGMLLL